MATESGASYDAGGAAVIVPLESFTPDRLRYELYEKIILVFVTRKRQTMASGPWGRLCCHAHLQPASRLVIARAGNTRWMLLRPYCCLVLLYRGQRCSCYWLLLGRVILLLFGRVDVLLPLEARVVHIDSMQRMPHGALATRCSS